MSGSNDTAATALVFDASGAVAGAAAFKAAADKIIAANNAVDAVFATSTKRVVESSTAQTRMLNNLAKAYDPLGYAIRKTQGDIEKMTDVLAQGGPRAAETATLLAAAQQRLAVAQRTVGDTTDKAAISHGNAAFAQRQLGVQTVQLFSSIQAGQPIMTALIGQGHQLLDVALSTGTGFGVLGQGIKTALGFMVSLPGLALTGAAALGAMAYVTESNERSLNTLGLRLSATRDNFAALAPAVHQAARELAAMTSLDTAQATVLIRTVYASPVFQGTAGQASDIAKTFSALNLIMGDSAEDATRLAEALADPAKVMSDLISKGIIKDVNGALLENARRMEAQGKDYLALGMLLDALKARTAGIKEPVTALQQAMRDLDLAYSKATGSTDGLAKSIGQNLDNGIAAAIGGMARLIEWMHRIGAFGNVPKVGEIVAPLPAGSPMGGVLGPSTVTNNNDAVGLFQLRRAAAIDAKMGVAPPGVSATPENDARFNYSANVTGGVTYFRQKLDEYNKIGGSIDDATRAYNQGFGGARSGLGGDYLAAVKKQDIGTLDPQVMQDIQRVFSVVFGDYAKQMDSPAIFDRILQVALQESGGRHYSAAAPARTMPAAPAAGGDVIPGGGVTSSALGPSNLKAATAAADEYKKSIQAQRLEIEDTIQKMTAYRDSVGANTVAGQHASVVIHEQQVALSGLKDKLTEPDKMVQQAQDRVAALLAESGAMRELFAIRVKYQELARDTHQPVNEAAILAEQAAKQRELSIAADDATRKMNLQAASEERLTPAIELGGIAAERAANHEKALNDARATAIPGDREYTRQVNEATAALDRNTMAKANNAAAAEVATLGKEADMLRLQTSLLGTSTEERNREIAALQERQKLGIAYGAELTSEQQKAVDAAKANADLRTSFQIQNQALNDFAGAFSQSFDTIGNAMTQAFVGGQGAAVNWKNVMTSVLQQVMQQFIKFALLNPLLNSLFPGSEHRTTLGDLFGPAKAVANAAGGGSDSGGAAGIAGGGLGLFGAGNRLFSGVGNLLEGNAWDGMAAGSGLAALDAQASYFAAQGFAYHTGGIVGRDGTPRVVNASEFAGAPRFHQGKGANEIFAILEKGEAVVTAQQQRAMAAKMNDNGRGDTHYHFNLPNLKDKAGVDTFRKTIPQTIRQATAHQMDTMNRNG